MSDFSKRVDDLRRAALGSAASQVKDEDLDDFAASLLVQEAKEKQKRYQDFGVSSFTQPSGPSYKTNKRFLRTIVNQTESHNRSKLNEQQQAADLKLRELDRLQRNRQRHATKKMAEPYHPFRRASSKTCESKTNDSARSSSQINKQRPLAKSIKTLPPFTEDEES